MADDQKPTDSVSFSLWGRKFGISATVLTILLPFAGGVFGAWFTLLTKDHELRIKLVEIGIGILRADPKDDITPARAWAIRVIENNSGVEFSEEDKTLLLHKPLLSHVGDYVSAGTNGGYIDTMGTKAPSTK